MGLCTWDPDRYGTGIERIDEQHRRLFELLNDLHEAVQSGETDVVGDHLAAIEEETQRHFSDEETLMHDCGYADDCGECFRNHHEAHADFATWVSEIRAKHERGEPLETAVLVFFRDWMDAHVAGDDQDQRLGEYCRQE